MRSGVAALVVFAMALASGASSVAGTGAEEGRLSAAVLPTEAGAHVLTTRLDGMPPLPPASPKDTTPPSPALAPVDLDGPSFSDPLAGGASRSVTAPRRVISFDGIGQTGRGAPPDPVGDVGPNHYVQAVNGAFAVYALDGRRLFGPAAIATLWQGIGHDCRYFGRGDPIVQYDALAKRWLITEFAFQVDRQGNPTGPFHQCVAISDTKDPMGRYHLYPFLVSRSYLPDYPKLGVWRDSYVMTVHLYDGSGDYEGQGIFAFDRLRMIEGKPAIRPIGLVEENWFGVLPADIDGTKGPAAGTPAYLIGVKDASGGLARDRLEVFELRVDWDNPAASSLRTTATLYTQSFDTNLCYGNLSCIPQPDTTRGLDPMADGVLMYRLAYRNLTTHESLVLNHVVDVDGTDHAGIRWYELRQPRDPFINLQGTFAPDGLHRWVASIAMDRSGNIGMGYSVSNEEVYPSVRFTGRLDGDPPSLMGTERSLVTGAGSQTGSSRWGDYSSLSVEPRNGCRFWYTQQYYRRTSRDGWSTRIGSFRFGKCGPTHTADPAPAPEPGTIEVPEDEGAGSDQTPPSIGAVSARPSPFTPNGDGKDEFTKVSFQLSERAHVTIDIFGRKGKVVRRISDARLSPGSWYARWYGNNSGRRPAASGKYRFRIRAVDQAGNDRSVWGSVRLQR